MGPGGSDRSVRERLGALWRRLPALTERTLVRFFNHRDTQTAAAISYYALLSMFPLAIVMVALTTLTLWSLGQDLVITPEQQQEQATAEAPLHARYQPG